MSQPRLGTLELLPGLEPGSLLSSLTPERGPAALELLKVLHADSRAGEEGVLLSRNVPKNKTSWKVFLFLHNIHTLLKFSRNGLILKGEE